MFDFLCAGARAYLPKDCDEGEILETIHAVARGQSRLTPGLTRKLIEEFRRLCLASRCGAAPYCNPEEPLTERENDILRLIVAGKGNKEIAGALKLAEGTVKNYVSRILEKLNVRSRTELVVKTLKRRQA
jgi:DNA-binding NarL/FixJ family response regulator